MTDHVSNLRSNALEWEDSQCSQRAKWAREAADEIERLRSTIQLDKWVLQESADEIERLVSLLNTREAELRNDLARAQRVPLGHETRGVY